MHPTSVSHKDVLWMSWEMEIHIWTNVLPLVVIASISFTCDVIIIKATADVNPEDTGPETKSIIKPETKNDICY